MRKSIDYSPSKAIVQLRLSQKRVIVKDKTLNENSLVVFKSKNKSFYFFHQMNEYIFLELPTYSIALFYFYSKTFKSNKEAFDEAMKTIKDIYNS